MRPHRRQPTRLPHPWDSPGKNTGVGCHFLLQCMKVKSESEVAQSYPTLSDPMDCSPPGSSIHRIFQARVLEWGATTFSEMVSWSLLISSSSTSSLNRGGEIEALQERNSLEGVESYMHFYHPHQDFSLILSQVKGRSKRTIQKDWLHCLEFRRL